MAPAAAASAPPSRNEYRGRGAAWSQQGGKPRARRGRGGWEGRLTGVRASLPVVRESTRTSPWHASPFLTPPLPTSSYPCFRVTHPMGPQNSDQNSSQWRRHLPVRATATPTDRASARSPRRAPCPRNRLHCCVVVRTRWGLAPRPRRMDAPTRALPQASAHAGTRDGQHVRQREGDGV